MLSEMTVFRSCKRLEKIDRMFILMGVLNLCIIESIIAQYGHKIEFSALNKNYFKHFKSKNY